MDNDNYFLSALSAAASPAQTVFQWWAKMVNEDKMLATDMIV